MESILIVRTAIVRDCQRPTGEPEIRPLVRCARVRLSFCYKTAAAYNTYSSVTAAYSHREGLTK